MLLLQLTVYGERHTRPGLQLRTCGPPCCTFKDMAKESWLGTHLDTSHGGTNVRLR